MKINFTPQQLQSATYEYVTLERDDEVYLTKLREKYSETYSKAILEAVKGYLQNDPDVPNIWVLTESRNDYNQHGDYLVTAFVSKPSLKQIQDAIGCDFILAKHISSGGGRIDLENNWYFLKSIQQGAVYPHSVNS